jgi:predicted PurR-regulated permease PerM
MESDTSKSSSTMTPPRQLVARSILAIALAALGAWILFDFLPALAWAGVLAIAVWPLYRLLLRLLPHRSERVLAPLLVTTVIAVVIIAPLVVLGIAIGRESHVVIGLVSEARHYGLAVPSWLQDLPFVGPTLSDWWRDNLTDPAVADDLIGRNLQHLTGGARRYGGEVVHRIALLFFTLLTLFFVFRDGSWLTERLRELSDRLIGRRGERIALQMIAAVHGTVTGLVLVGLAEGIFLGIVYVIAGLPYPASFGAVTGVAAVIPFAAPTVYVLAGLYLVALGNTFGGVLIVVLGSVVVFVADHFVRPFLIGGAARLPFLWVLLGILGGLETMGFLGLFIGPAVMAALIALWREWTEPGHAAAPALMPTAARRSPARPGRVRKV